MHFHARDEARFQNNLTNLLQKNKFMLPQTYSGGCVDKTLVEHWLPTLWHLGSIPEELPWETFSGSIERGEVVAHQLDHILSVGVGSSCNFCNLENTTCWSQGEAMTIAKNLRSLARYPSQKVPKLL